MYKTIQQLKKTQFALGYPEKVKIWAGEYDGKEGWWLAMMFGKVNPFIYKQFLKYKDGLS